MKSKHKKNGKASPRSKSWRSHYHTPIYAENIDKHEHDRPVVADIPALVYDLHAVGVPPRRLSAIARVPRAVRVPAVGDRAIYGAAGARDTGASFNSAVYREGTAVRRAGDADGRSAGAVVARRVEVAGGATVAEARGAAIAATGGRAGAVPYAAGGRVRAARGPIRAAGEPACAACCGYAGAVAAAGTTVRRTRGTPDVRRLPVGRTVCARGVGAGDAARGAARCDTGGAAATVR